MNYVTASLYLAAGPLETNRWRQSSSVTDSTFRLFHLHSRLNQRYVSLRTVRTGLQHSSVPRQTPATFCSAELHTCPCGAVRNECMSLFDYLWNWSDGLILGDNLFLLRLPLARNYVDWLWQKSFLVLRGWQVCLFSVQHLFLLIRQHVSFVVSTNKQTANPASFFLAYLMPSSHRGSRLLPELFLFLHWSYSPDVTHLRVALRRDHSREL